MKLIEVGGIAGLNDAYRTHAPTYLCHSVLHAAMKPVRSSKLGISHQCNALCAKMRKTHIAPCNLDKPCVLSNGI